MGEDAVIRLALEVAAILGIVLAAAAIAFYALSRLITKGLDELAAGAVVAQRAGRQDAPFCPIVGSRPGRGGQRLERAPRPDRGAGTKTSGGRAARRLGGRWLPSRRPAQEPPRGDSPRGRKLGAYRSPKSAGPRGGEPARTSQARESQARESLKIVRVEADRLRALIDRFRDLAPEGLDAYGSQRD